MPITSDFLAEYKQLESLLNDIYMCKNGVSAYITHMENERSGGRYVVNWEKDYKDLKSIRQMRNLLAHDTAVNEIDDYEYVRFTTNFRERILTGSDPLTRLRKAQNETKQRAVSASAGTSTVSNSRPVNHAHTSYPSVRPSKNRFSADKIFGLAIFIVIVLVVISIIFLR